MAKPGKTTGAFSRVMQHGQRKVQTTAETRALLLALSEDDHKRIATLIKKWLDDDAKRASSSVKK